MPVAKLSSTRFTVRLVLGTLLLNLLVGALSLMSLYGSQRKYEERSAVATQNLSQLLEHDLAAFFGKADLALLALADEVEKQVAGRRIDGPGLQAVMDRQFARHANLSTLRIANAKGDIIFGTGVSPSTHANASDRDYFTRHRAGPAAGLLFSKAMIGRVTGAWVVALSRRLNEPDGSFAGVVSTSVKIEDLLKLFSTMNLGAHGAVILRDGELAVVQRYPEVSNIIGEKNAAPEFKGLIASGWTAGTYKTTGPIDHIERTYSYRQISSYPLYILVGLATEDTLAEWRGEAAKTASLLVLFFLATGFSSWLIIRAWKRQIATVKALTQQEVKFRTLLESTPDALVIVDADGVINIVNRRAQEMFGYGQDELFGLPVEILLPERYRSGHVAMRQRYATLKQDATTGVGRDLCALTKEGHEFPASISLSPIATEQGPMVAAAIRDISERKSAEQQIEFLAYHDALTGLPNRLLVQDRLQQAIASADRAGTRVALLFLDLDKFKTINDSLGHAVGDGLLKSAAHRLGECVRDTDTISRQGGDEFLIVLRDLPDTDAITPILLKLVERLQKLFDVDGHELTISISLGVALYPEDGRDFDTLLKKADMAMYRAKDAGRNTYRFFDEQMNVEAIEHLKMSNGLRRGLERGEFSLYYQPQIDLARRAVIGAEALVRWNHPELGMILPGRFIPVAEESGLVVPLGEWVLREACRQAVAWNEAGLPELVIAVNLSAMQFKRGDVERTVINALKDSGLDPSLLELELTESILIHDTEHVLATVKRLKLLGVKLSIDDFGTGYSSLSYLKRFSVDKLKIDQAFIRDLATDPEDAAIVRAIIQMAKSLGLTTIAEGVEEDRILDQLRVFHCDEAQGYLFARPMPAEEFAAYLAFARPILS